MPPVKTHTDQNDLIPTKKFKYASWPFKNFNPIQSRAFELYDKDANCLVSASTSSGKTLVAELYLSHEIRVRGGKGMFLSPFKALSQEKIDDWTSNDCHFKDLNISICTGDYRLTPDRKKELENADLIIMTSEMLNSFSYNTEIFCHKNGNVWLDKIGRIVEEEIDCEVFSYHHKKGMFPTAITGRIDCGVKPVFELLLRGGRSVKMTSDHNVFTKDGDDISEIKLSDVRCGMSIAISKGFNTPSTNSTIDLLPILRKSKRRVYVFGQIIDELLALSTKQLHALCPLGAGKEEKLTIGTSRRRFQWKKRNCLPLARMTDECLKKYGDLIKGFKLYHSNYSCDRHLKVDKEMAYFFGFYVAEGAVSQNHVMCYQKNSQVLNNIMTGLNMGTIRQSKDQIYYIDICNSLIGEICKEFGPNARKKRCPSWIFTWRKEEIEFFLDGFVEGDGSICEYKNGTIRENNTNAKLKRYHSSSLELLKGLRNLLLLVNRQSWLCRDRKNETQYCLGEWSSKHPWLGKAEQPTFPDLAFVPVKSIKFCGKEKVYDLEVQPNIGYKIENFIGGNGGILLHNSRCRNFESEQNEFLNKIGTLVIDEAHLLTQTDRGPNLEAALMKFSQINPTARIVMLSATMPNVLEIAEWVSYSLTRRETHLINSKFRPCPLQIHYETYWDGSYKYEQNEGQKVAAAIRIIEDYPDDKFLIFAHTKRTGEMMKQQLKNHGFTCEFHNADLDKSKRVKVENEFREGELQVVVATSTLSAGLNMPARRVIVLGVHRGLSEVSSLDIIQECGRAGRPKYDKRGDAYILLPERKAAKYIESLQSPENIKSQMLDQIGGNHKTLAFHIVSEIHHGNIKTSEDVHEWYEKSLAYFQDQEFGDGVVDNVLNLLVRCGAIYEKNDVYLCSSVGIIASLFYYSPFDVANLKRGFTALFHNKNEENDFWLSISLGNTDTHQKGIVSKAEREAMSEYSTWVKRIMGEVDEPVVKAGYAYYNLLNGRSSKAVVALERNLRLDFPRVTQVLKAIDSMSAKWDKGDFFQTLSMRIAYGVEEHLIDLCKVPNVGKVRAELLYNGGIKTPQDIVANSKKAVELLKMKKESAEKIVKEAKKIGDKK